MSRYKTYTDKEAAMVALKDTERTARIIIKNVEGLLLPGRVTRDVKFVNCSFADVSSTSFDGCEFDSCPIAYLKARNCKFVACSYSTKVTSLFGTRYTNCVFDDLYASGNLTGVVFTNCKFKSSGFEMAHIRGTDFTGSTWDTCSYFKDCQLEKVVGLRYVTTSFSGFGECNRTITAVKLHKKWTFQCGCFTGNEDQLESYIALHGGTRRKSRMFALNYIREAIKYSEPPKKKTKTNGRRQTRSTRL